MPYMSFEEQIKSHLRFLQDEGMCVEQLHHNGIFIRCRAIGDGGKNRGEYAYKTWVNQMHNGCVGVETWVRGLSGKVSTHKTYGVGNGDVDLAAIRRDPTKGNVEEGSERIAEEKAQRYFEIHSTVSGESKYLNAKKVKIYGVRFHKNEKYGTAVVVPARDIRGKIKTCQNINEDGSKRWLSGRAATGTFHALSPLHGSPVIGICEGYATSATCAEALEGLAISVVCAFDATNLDKVGKEIHAKYPTAKILFLADNDRHLVQAGLKNKGLEAARMTSNELMATSAWLAPDFANLEPLKGLSDWNDLATVFGIVKVRGQITKFLASIGFRGQENI